jgi:DNA-binding NarL/FixJ family response regulator
MAGARRRRRAIRLTPRQKDVLHWILKGCTNHAIATALGISAETVKLHVSAIFRAYGVHSRTQLVLLCSRSPSVMAAVPIADEEDSTSPAAALAQHAATARENTA